MFQPVYEFDLIRSKADITYRPRAYGELDPTGRWNGWLVFFPVSAGSVISTARETTQLSLPALVDWAGGLTRGYLSGALVRALDLQAALLEDSEEALEAPLGRGLRKVRSAKR